MAVDQKISPCSIESSSIAGGRQILDKIFAVIVLLLTTACANQTALETLASQKSLELRLLTETEPPLWALRNAANGPTKTLVIYLGGDGVPWRGDRPAVNPDGRGVLAAELSLTDSRPAIYLGRPCYHWSEMPATCTGSRWTSERYSRETVALLASAVESLQLRSEAESLILIGYSGGGVLALMVAEQIDAVTRVVTVAANLDTDAWTTFHDLLPLEGSLNPAASLAAPTHFEQIHLQGTNDDIVPAATTNAYRDAHPEALFLSVEGFGHRCCWREHWRGILDYLDDDVGNLRGYPALPIAGHESH